MSADASERGARAARFVFVAVEIVGFVLYAYRGRHLWFRLDEWDFLAVRHLSVHDLLLPHGGHLVALPAFIWRAMFAIFGLHSYAPYQLLSIATYLAIAALLRMVMRRAHVDPWIATAAATLFVLFGAASDDVLWAFQITFTGAVAFGLGQLLLADHDGSWNRRDWFGLLSGLAAVCCSGVALPLVAAVGVATLLRRGWKIALAHTLPFLALFEIWLHRYNARGEPTTSDLGLIARWTGRGLWATFDQLGQVPLAGWLLAAVLVVGLGVAIRSWRGHGLRRRASLPVALVVGALAFLVLTGYGRAWTGLQNAGASRYLAISGALLLPPIAVAADALIRVRRVLLIPLIALLLVGIPGNVGDVSNNVASRATTAQLRLILVSLPRMPLATRVPRDVEVDPNTSPGVTIGWLLDTLHAGKLPKPYRTLTPAETATNTLRLSLAQERIPFGAPCVPMRRATVVNVAKGQVLRIRGVVTVQLLGGAVPSFPLLYGATFIAGAGDHTLTAVVDPLRLRVTPRSANASIC